MRFLNTLSVSAQHAHGSRHDHQSARPWTGGGDQSSAAGIGPRRGGTDVRAVFGFGRPRSHRYRVVADEQNRWVRNCPDGPRRDDGAHGGALWEARKGCWDALESETRVPRDLSLIELK